MQSTKVPILAERGYESGYYITHLTRGVVAERIRAPNSRSADSVQQSGGSSRDTCVPEQDTLL